MSIRGYRTRMKMLTKIKEVLEDTKDILQSPDFPTLPSLKRRLYSVIKVLWIVVKGCKEDRLTLRASSMTYIFLISLVPFLVLIFSLAKGLGVDSKIKQEINELVVTLPEGTAETLNTVITTVESADYKALGTIGLLLALLTSLKLMTSVEVTFNHIWGIKYNRTFARRFADYLAIIITVPLLVLVSSSVSAFMSSDMVIDKMTEWAGPLVPLYGWLMGLAGIFSIIAAFTVLYILMPNTKVKISSALMGGTFGGLAWKLMQILYIKFQIGVGSANALYGTFAAIPLFLAWVYLSWLIVLLGAEVSFAVQHRRTYELEDLASSAGHRIKTLLAALILVKLCKDFEKGVHDFDATTFADEYRIPHRLVQEVLFVLASNNVIRKIEDSDHYLPARRVASLSLKDVHKAFEGESSEYLDRISQRADCTFVLSEYEKLTRETDSQAEGVTMADLVAGSAAKPAPSK